MAATTLWPRPHDRQHRRKVGRSIRVERLRMRKRLTHVEADGSVRMVDVGAKPSTARTATAEALVRMSSGALRALKSGALKKVDALAVARIAGIQAAKR